MTYLVEITRDESGVWLANVPALDGAHTDAVDRNQLDVNVREVIALAEDLPDGAEAGLELTYRELP